MSKCLAVRSKRASKVLRGTLLYFVGLTFSVSLKVPAQSLHKILTADSLYTVCKSPAAARDSVCSLILRIDGDAVDGANLDKFIVLVDRLPRSAQAPSGGFAAASAGTSAAAAGITQGGALTAVTDVLLDKAEEEFDQYIVSKFANAICSADLKDELKKLDPGINESDTLKSARTLKHVFSATCQLLAPAGTNITTNWTMPGVAAVRSAIRMDLAAAPDSLYSLLSNWGVFPSSSFHARLSILWASYYIGNQLSSAVAHPTGEAPNLPAILWSAADTTAAAAAAILAKKGAVESKDLSTATWVLGVAATFGAVWSHSEHPETPNALARVALMLNVCGTQGLYIGVEQPPTWAKGMDAQTTIQRALGVENANCAAGLNKLMTRDTVATILTLVNQLATVTSYSKGTKFGGAAIDQSLIIKVAMSGVSILMTSQSSDSRLNAVGVYAGQIGAAIQVKDYASASVDLSALIWGLVEDDKTTPPNLTRLVTLAADLATAQDASTVKSAMEKFISPAGSFARKRLRKPDGGWYLSVDAYAGVAAGQEFTGGHNGVAAGPYLPVGPEFGFAPAKLGLFIQVLDLGQIASWRLTGYTNVTKSPNIQIKNVFAPGAYLMYGISRTIPITMGVGANWAPWLRSLNNNGVAGTPVNVVRVNAIIALDLVLFP